MNGDRHRDRLGPKAESHRKLAFDVAELRVHHLEPNPAPRDLADRDGPVTEEERHAIAEHRTDAVDTPAPRERRVTPTEPSLDGANRRLDRQSTPPSVVADAPDSFPRARDGAPPVPAPLNREFAPVDEDPVPQDSELRLDDHVLDIEAGLHKRSPGMPGRKPLSEGSPVRPTPCSSTSTTTHATPRIPAWIRRRSWSLRGRFGWRGSRLRITIPSAASPRPSRRRAATSWGSRRSKSPRNPAMCSGTESAKSAGAVGVDDVLQLLAQGRTSAQGLDRGPAATARYVTKAVGEWMLRGMRRI